LNVDLPWSASQRLVIDVIVPARNNASTLAASLAALPLRRLRSVVVVDNGSTDGSAQVARDAGAVVLRESRVGIGAACLRAVAHLEVLPRPPDAVVFVPADGSVRADELPLLLAPLTADNAELVIGVRRDLKQSPVRTQVAIRMISAIYGHRFADLGPFRAVRFPALVAMGMSDRGAGWNVEMQLKSIRLGLHVVEVPVSYRAPMRRPTRTKQVAESVDKTGRVLFQILRNATVR
jgi:glycosyltransferase involved in cell wall biosynthesis